MRRILLRVAYDGTAYHGWQEQPNAITVEGKLNEALTKLNGTQIHVIGASRTDAGVHAIGNVAVFDTEMRMEADKFKFALNTMLPDDIVIQASSECPLDFHPRKCDCKKTYEYVILNRQIALPKYRSQAYFFYQKLDMEKMRQAAVYFKGRHDFKAFCSANTTTSTTVRTIYDVKILEEKLEEGGRLVKLQITGNGFLYNMVRIITGTLLHVGIGKIEPEKIPGIIVGKERSMAGPTAPPEGLSLQKIVYKNKNVENK